RDSSVTGVQTWLFRPILDPERSGDGVQLCAQPADAAPLGIEDGPLQLDEAQVVFELARVLERRELHLGIAADAQARSGCEQLVGDRKSDVEGREPAAG